MADQVSDIPVEDKQDKDLTETHADAVAATTPLEKPADQSAKPQETQPATTSAFNKAKENKGQDATLLSMLASGPAEMSMGAAFDKILLALSLLLTDPEMFPAFAEALYPKSTYKDPGERAEKVRDLHEVVMDENHPDREMDVKDFAVKYMGQDGEGLKDVLERLDPSVSKLMKTILAKESAGGDPNIIWDYRNRLGISSRGLQPGDTTHQGTKVPDVSTMTVNQVIDWQRGYLNEQKALGIPASRRSSAAGMGQFTYTTLKEMRDDGKIDGNALFNRETQIDAMEKRLQWRIDRAYNAAQKDGKITIKDFQKEMERELKNEWEGLQNSDAQTSLREFARETAVAALSPPPSNPNV